MYPNPAIESFFIYSEEAVTDVWIVRASPEKIYQDEDFRSILNPALYPQQTLNLDAALSFHEQTSILSGVSIATLEKGYYRVFVKIGGAIYWDNLYKINAGNTYEEQANAAINYWN